MAAFDKIPSGFPQMDEILDSIRLGDNVVWQISDLEEFRTFAEPFARRAVRDGRNVIYIRFAQHEPVLQDLTGIQVRHFNPDGYIRKTTDRCSRPDRSSSVLPASLPEEVSDRSSRGSHQ